MFSLLVLAHITQCDIKTQTLRPFIIEEKLRAAGLQRYGVKRTVETRFSSTPWKQIKFCLSDRWFCYVCLILSFGLICEKEHFRSLSVSNARKSLFLFLFIFYFYFYNFQLHTLTSFARAWIYLDENNRLVIKKPPGKINMQSINNKK